MIISGLAALCIGGAWVVDGAVALASLFGMSEAVVELTIVAVGTSLPELVTSVVAAKRGMTDVAIGNVVGSNIFNILWILGLSAVITPLQFGIDLALDLAVVIVTTTMMLTMLLVGKKKMTIDRGEGILLVGIYILYIAYLVVRSTIV